MFYQAILELVEQATIVVILKFQIKYTYNLYVF